MIQGFYAGQRVQFISKEMSFEAVIDFIDEYGFVKFKGLTGRYSINCCSPLVDPSEEYYSEVGSSVGEFENIKINWADRKIQSDSFDDLIVLVKMWATEKGIHTPNCTQGQVFKIFEEVTEMCQAWQQGDKEEMIDGLGDSFVTLIIFALQQNLDPVSCLRTAYDVISKRKGKKINGVFKKD